MTRQAFSPSSPAYVFLCTGDDVHIGSVWNTKQVCCARPGAKCTKRETQHWKEHLTGRVLLEGSQSYSWSLSVTSKSVVSPAVIHE